LLLFESPSSLKQIENHAFNGCNMIEIGIPDTWKLILLPEMRMAGVLPFSSGFSLKRIEERRSVS
jgi:hypothetical protein